jgi:hypothetical protein
VCRASVPAPHPATEELPLRARCTTRLKTALLDAVADSGRAVAEVAADYTWRGGRCRRR